MARTKKAGAESKKRQKKQQDDEGATAGPSHGAGEDEEMPDAGRGDMPRAGDPGALPPEIEKMRTRVICGHDENRHPETVTAANAYMALGVDNSMTRESFKEGFSVQVNSMGEDEMEFEMKGTGPAIANAFRRILIAEVPTMAIEKVYVANNTSVVQDEVLAHRLGLVPIAADPRLFAYWSEGSPYTESNSVVFSLSVTCRKERAADTGEERKVHENVYSSDLTWMPGGSDWPPENEAKFTNFGHDQSELHPQGFKPVQGDILLARLRPGQTIDLQCVCVKGVGKTHAKWSPVGTAWYRLQPEVALLRDVAGEDAKVFMERVACDERCSCFGLSGGVVRVRQSTGCQWCRERLRLLSGEVGWGEKVELRKIKDHFVFTVESTGALPPDVLFSEAVKVLAAKCKEVLSLL